MSPVDKALKEAATGSWGKAEWYRKIICPEKK
jgi:hypothetical protein